MLRVIGLTLLVAFAPGPPLEWLCAEECVTAHEAAHATCHGAQNPTPRMAAADDCHLEAAMVASIPARIQNAQDLHALTASGAMTVRRASIAPASAVTHALDSGPPITTLLIPLRI